jgi:hypothetical protein
MELKAGMVIRHHSGRVYSVLHIANTHGKDLSRFPATVVYRGANGHVWARPAAEFDGKFTVLFDGTNLAH